jgi:hypothetical protein
MARKDLDARREYARAYRAANRERLIAADRARYAQERAQRLETGKRYYAEHKEDVLWKNRAKKFGLTQAGFDALLVVQRGACAICCERLDPKSRHTHVDHDHKTGKVRGLLCNHCNRMLGAAFDSPERLLMAVRYLDVAAGREP